MKKLLFGSVVSIFLILLPLIKPPKLVEGASFSMLKNTLQSSRISFAGRVDATGTSAGSSVVKLKNTSLAPYYSLTTANLKASDAITINGANYTIVGILDSTSFTVNPVVATLDAVDLSPIRLRSKPQHVISLTTASAVANGYFRILLPADSTSPNDGNPDDEGFDFGNDSVSVAATDIANYDFVAGVATASGDPGCTSPTNYHCFEVHYTGTGALGSTITITIGTTGGGTTPIAPAPGTSLLGTAETYPYIARNYTTSGNDILVDNASGKVAFLEGVRVTATVDPTISMTICGDTDCLVQDVNPGDIVDGETLSSNAAATSNATAVALGVLDLLAPRMQAQKITVATNASSGYVLTALDDGNLRKGTDTIDDVVTPPTAPGLINVPGTEAYGIHASGVHVNAGTWGTGGAGANNYSGTDAATALTLASIGTPVGASNTYITYKANIAATTVQGEYEHAVFYTATATF